MVVADFKKALYFAASALGLGLGLGLGWGFNAHSLCSTRLWSLLPAAKAALTLTLTLKKLF